MAQVKFFEKKSQVFLIGLAIGIVLLLKIFQYQTFIDNIRWILLPVKILVVSWTDLAFVYKSHVGYIEIHDRIVLDKSCTGLNFLLIAFCTGFFGFVFRISEYTKQLKWLAFCFIAAYFLTTLFNSIRIVTILWLSVYVPAINPLKSPFWHESIGVFTYLIGLLLYYSALRWWFERDE
jgi:exosortase K